jgi:hypothetical protein
MTGERADQASTRAGIAGPLNMNYTAEDGGVYICKIYHVPEERFDAA